MMGVNFNSSICTPRFLDFFVSEPVKGMHQVVVNRDIHAIYCWSLSRFLQNEAIRSIATPPGWDATVVHRR